MQKYDLKSIKANKLLLLNQGEKIIIKETKNEIDSSRSFLWFGRQWHQCTGTFVVLQFRCCFSHTHIVAKKGSGMTHNPVVVSISILLFFF